MNIHPNLRNKFNSSGDLIQASAVPLAQCLTKISPDFIAGHQEDPSEFFVVLLHHMMDCLSSTYSCLFAKYMSSPLHSILGLNVKSSIKCTLCLHERISENYESLLPISINYHSDLQNALTAFFSQVTLSGENSSDCSKCKTKTTALKSVALANISSVLFIQLKRFNYDRNTNVIRKIRHFVSYPEFLDLMPYVDKHSLQPNRNNDQLNKFIWQLNSVLVHLGDTANDGHVYSHIRSPDGAWYKADDEKVSPVDLKHVLSENDSYILCYTKMSEERISSFHIETNNYSEQSTRNIRSSTPIRPYKIRRRAIDIDSPVRKFSQLNLFDLFSCRFKYS